MAYIGMDSCMVNKPDDSSGELILLKQEVLPFCTGTNLEYMSNMVKLRMFDFIKTILKPQYKIHSFSEYDNGYLISFSDVDGIEHDPTLIISRNMYIENDRHPLENGGESCH